jgi:hypothetical protein
MELILEGMYCMPSLFLIETLLISKGLNSLNWLIFVPEQSFFYILIILTFKTPGAFKILRRISGECFTFALLLFGLLAHKA